MLVNGVEANPWPWLACCQGSKAFGLYESNPDVSVLKKCVSYRLPILMPGTHCRTWLPEGAGFPDFLLKLDLIKMEKTTCSDIGTCMVFV